MLVLLQVLRTCSTYWAEGARYHPEEVRNTVINIIDPNNTDNYNATNGTTISGSDIVNPNFVINNGHNTIVSGINTNVNATSSDNTATGASTENSAMHWCALQCTMHWCIHHLPVGDDPHLGVGVGTLNVVTHCEAQDLETCAS